MVKNKLYFEDVQEGQSIPSLVKHPTPRQLVMWAAASEEYHEIHYHLESAKAEGLPGIIVHGMLQLSFMGQMLTDWIGDWGTLKKIASTNRAIVVPNQDLTCKGKITKKYSENGENLVACDIWVETAKGETAVKGNAVFSLPSNTSN